MSALHRSDRIGLGDRSRAFAPTIPTAACINRPLEYRFRGRISDAQHLSVDPRGRRVVSSPRLAELPIGFSGRLTIDVMTRAASFAFVGGGDALGEPYTFAFEIGGLWDGLVAGGYPRDLPVWGGADALAAAWDRSIRILDVFQTKRFELSLDPESGTGHFRWKQTDAAPDAPAWLDRSATGEIEELWRPRPIAPSVHRAGP